MKEGNVSMKISSVFAMGGDCGYGGHGGHYHKSRYGGHGYYGHGGHGGYGGYGGYGHGYYRNYYYRRGLLSGLLG